MWTGNGYVSAKTKSSFLHNQGMIRVMIMKKRDVNGFKGSWEGITTSTAPFETVIVGTVYLDERMIGVTITVTNRAEIRAGFQKIHFLETGLFTFLNDVKYMVECSHYAGENNRNY
jgi:hypothetical protein